MSKAAAGIGTLLGFALGGATGFLVSKQFFQTKYQKIADDEIESVKSAFRKDHKPIGKKETPKKEPEKGIGKYTDYRKVLKYKTETPALDEGEKPVIREKEPYVIAPDAFGEDEDYEQVSLTYYRGDGVVADDDDRALSTDEVRKAIGLDSLNHFGEYEADSVFVRNEDTQTEYEVLLDQRSYATLKNERPYL